MKDQLEQILYKVSLSPAMDEGNLDDAYRLVIDSVIQGLGVSRVGIWYTLDNPAGLACKLLIDLIHQKEMEEMVLYASDYPKYFKAISDSRYIMANDALTHPQTAEFAKGYLRTLGISSILDIPIRHRGLLIGVICCEHIGPPREWSVDEANFTLSLAVLIGRAINAHQQSELRQELHRVNSHLEELVSQRTEELHQTVSKLQMAKDQLVDSEKLAALGSLVAGVAHEVNTPLGISITAASALGEEIDSLRKAHEKDDLTVGQFKSFLDSVTQMNLLLMSNLNRASALIKNFKQTAVDQTDDSEHVFFIKWHLDHLVSSLLPETKKIPVMPRLIIDSKSRIISFPSVWGQIFTNLILNSCRHAFQGIAKPMIEIQIEKTLEGHMLVIYRDNGIGVPPDNEKKIMDPFFTTKRGKGGTGLGLSIVHTLVHGRLKGKLEVMSNWGKGLEFRITCPASIWA